MAEDGAAEAGVAALAEELQRLVEDRAVVLLQRLVELRCAVGGRGVAGQGAGEHRDRSGDRPLCRLRVEAELLADRCDALRAELRVEQVKNGSHDDSSFFTEGPREQSSRKITKS